VTWTVNIFPGIIKIQENPDAVGFKSIRGIKNRGKGACMAAQVLYTWIKKENPRLCRVNHLFEPFEKVGAYYCCFRRSASGTSG